MKTEKKGVEGQLDIFEAMNRAADAMAVRYCAVRHVYPVV